MKILPIQYQQVQNNRIQKIKNVTLPQIEQKNYISSGFYYPDTTFKGQTMQSEAIKKVARGMFPKLKSIYTPDGAFIDLKKITFENLLSEKFDITKATKNEITAYRGFLALLEAYAKNPEDSGDFASQWGQKYKSLSAPLAVSHFLSSLKMQEDVFAVNRAMLKDPNRCKSLDVAIFDAKDNFNIDAVGFDTETTGTNINEDKIVQIGAVLLTKGKITKTYDQLINPEMHIPDGATAVNHISDEMVANAPKIQEVMKDFLANIMCKKNGIIITWNGVQFDVPLVNRIIREIRVGNDIKKGSSWDKIVMEKQLFKVVDAQILHMRIHPFVGTSKRLPIQHHWLTCQHTENAHNATPDAEMTIDMFKYDAYWLNAHRIDKTKPLTLRQLLLFQNGEPEVPNLDIKLDPFMGINTSVDFNTSYKRPRLKLKNHFDKYDLNEKVINKLKNEIGQENIERLKSSGIINAVIDDTYKGHPLQASETKKRPISAKKKTLGYEMRKNLETLLEIAKVDGFNGKSKEEIRDLIAENCRTYTDTIKNEKLARGLVQKNIDQTEKGNDLIDDRIAKRVVRENQN